MLSASRRAWGPASVHRDDQETSPVVERRVNTELLGHGGFGGNNRHVQVLLTCQDLAECLQKHRLTHSASQPRGTDAVPTLLQTSPLRPEKSRCSSKELITGKSPDSKPGGPISGAHDPDRHSMDSSQGVKADRPLPTSLCLPPPPPSRLPLSISLSLSLSHTHTHTHTHTLLSCSLKPK